MQDASNGARYIVVSSDSHAGLPWAEYGRYMDPAHRTDFEQWLRTVTSPDVSIGGTRVDTRGKTIRDAFAREPAVREGGVAGAWDPGIRAREMDRDGVAAEVVFPDGLNQNGIPFNGMGSLDPAANAYDFELRLAGCRADNRWLADLSAANPGRHAGIAVVPFDDPEIAVREIEVARSTGLSGGVLLPGLPLATTDATWMLHHPRYEPIWAACADLGMPVNIHSTGAGVDYGELPGSRWIHTTEAYWTSRRPVWQLLWAGVLERHPALKVAMTEVMGAWAPFELQYWEYLYDARNPELIREALPLRPSEYWARQCYVGASPPAGRLEVESRHVIGVNNMMWGSDYPHPDGAWPQSRRRIAEMFSGVPEAETRRILGENALEVYGFDPVALRAIADRVGIAPGDIGDTPVDWEQPHKLAYVTGITTVAGSAAGNHD
jgi:predicted TIM-barrel fold metal-dependent hydrolase